MAAFLVFGTQRVCIILSRIATGVAEGLIPRMSSLFGGSVEAKNAEPFNSSGSPRNPRPLQIFDGIASDVPRPTLWCCATGRRARSKVVTSPIIQEAGPNRHETCYQCLVPTIVRSNQIPSHTKSYILEASLPKSRTGPCRKWVVRSRKEVLHTYSVSLATVHHGR